MREAHVAPKPSQYTWRGEAAVAASEGGNPENQEEIHATEIACRVCWREKRVRRKRPSGTSGCVSHIRLLSSRPSSGPNLKPCPLRPVAKAMRESPGKTSRIKSSSGETS